MERTSDAAAHGPVPGRCVFCFGALVPWVRGAYHPTIRDHGPFDLYRCAACRSVVTAPPPDAERLAGFYARYEDGQAPHLLRVREDSPQIAWYSQCADHIAAFAHPSSDFTWLEVAAGSGTFARLFATRFPASSGTALDYHPRPADLSDRANVRWRQGDLNVDAPDAETYDVVAALSVLEHVPDVEGFVRRLVRSVRPGGTLYVVCPDATSPMARLLAKRWPYYLPGEHLHVPSLRGARALLDRVLASEGRTARSRVRPITVPYTVRYLAAYAGLGAPARVLPKTLSVPVPAGALEIAATIA